MGKKDKKNKKPCVVTKERKGSILNRGRPSPPRSAQEGMYPREGIMYRLMGWWMKKPPRETQTLLDINIPPNSFKGTGFVKNKSIPLAKASC